MARYLEAEREVAACFKQHGLACDTAEDVDFGIEAYANKLNFAGEPAAALRYALYSYAFVHDFPTAGPSFSRCKRALRSWLRINPEYSRDPCPFVAMGLIVESLVKHDGPLGLMSARCVALKFDAYLRLGEAMSLRLEDMIFPSTDKAYGTHALIVAPQPGPELLDHSNDVRRPAKTGHVDCTVLIRDEASKRAGRAYRRALMAALFRPHAAKARVFEGLTAAKFEALFRRAVQRLELGALALCPHTLRHGGPSEDTYRQARGRSAIQKRGRWSSPASVMRYEKHGCLLRQVRRMTEDQRRRGCSAISQLADLLALKGGQQRRPAARDLR